MKKVAIRISFEADSHLLNLNKVVGVLHNDVNVLLFA
jgi:hypothetical protein